MTEKQIRIADKLLQILMEHDGRINKHNACSLLLKEFTERTDRIDISFVFDTLIDDYKLVALLGEGWLRLTPEGQKMARRGMKNYQRKLTIKEWWKESKTAAILISLVSTLIGSVITVLITALLG